MLTLTLPPDFPLRNFLPEIAPGDQMFAGNSEHYLAVGVSAMRIFEYAVSEGFTPEQGPRNILDLPCGHGRVARVLRSQFPSADLTVCDIDRDGVDFCVSRLGARGVYSCMDFDKLELCGVFDLIFVGSLITHLNAYNTVTLLRRMESCLSQDGVMIISNHGARVVERAAINAYPSKWVIDQFNITGHGSDANACVHGYGDSVISRHWLEGFFAGEPCGIVAYLEHEWGDYHDVLFVKKRPLLPAEFDAQKYLRVNPDVAEVGVDPVQHYLLFGRKEGRRLR
jgi:SAM-dependent methyltransferase